MKEFILMRDRDGDYVEVVSEACFCHNGFVDALSLHYNFNPPQVRVRATKTEPKCRKHVVRLSVTRLGDVVVSNRHRSWQFFFYAAQFRLKWLHDHGYRYLRYIPS